MLTLLNNTRQVLPLLREGGRPYYLLILILFPEEKHANAVRQAG